MCVFAISFRSGSKLLFSLNAFSHEDVCEGFVGTFFFSFFSFFVIFYSTRNATACFSLIST